MRRLKEDVLQDLPPKIIQDYYCDLSPLQVLLYEKSFSSAKTKSIVVSGSTVEKNNPHVFQALQYLKKVCSYPALVVTPDHPKFADVEAYLKSLNSDLHDIQHTAKLVALRQLLLDCGLGLISDESEIKTKSDILPGGAGQHRVLLFAQSKHMLDIVEQDLLKTLLPSISYKRLDGTTASKDRYALTTEFNDDPTIDLLLLTTHVGGLGLNLTG